MDDLSNREMAQETPDELPGDELTDDQRDALKHCLDDFVALMNAQFVDGTGAPGGPKQPN